MVDVIGVGYGRTGTFSLKHALEQLGFGPCYHGFELLWHPERLPLWQRATAGEAVWEEVFAGYRATVDWPGIEFWPELVDAYPDARVVLTLRDPDRWFDSMRLFREVLSDPQVRAILAERASGPGETTRMYDVDLADRAAMVQRFERHTEEVRAKVSADRLLVYEVNQGWDPLCEFLGVPVPESEFPHRYEASELLRLITDETD